MAFGASPVALAVTALQSLASTAFWKSAAIAFTTNIESVEIQVAISTANSGAGSATGYLNVYLACSIDNTTYDGRLSAGDATWAPTAPVTAEAVKQLQFLGRMSLGSVATTTITGARHFFLLPGTIPKYGVIVIENATGKALLSSGNAVTYLENTPA